MKNLARGVSIIALAGFAVGLAYAADQTILGKQEQVKDPKPGVDATKRKLIGQAKEKVSPNTIVGNPTVTGASIEFFATGTTSTSQTFPLPAGNWKASSTGFKYKDSAGVAGPVKVAAITKSKSGTFQIKAVVLGKLGPINVVPPNLGVSGCVRLTINGGDSYDVAFNPPSTIKKNDVKTFLVKAPANEGLCPVVTTTTTSSTTTTIPYGSPSRAFVGTVSDLLD
jgi:hypothetical protein